MAPTAIATSPAGCPLWPGRVVGSITHASGMCAAMAAHAHDLPWGGIDLETAQPLPVAVLELVCTEAELRQLPDGSAGLLLAQVVFTPRRASTSYSTP